MIKERLMTQGKRIMDDTLVIGYFYISGADRAHFIREDDGWGCHVDPATVEPVAVGVKNVAETITKGIWCGNCPNCNNNLQSCTHSKYCTLCGQRLDWSVA